MPVARFGAPPDPAFWLGELRLGTFPDLLSLLHHPDRARAAAAERCGAAAAEAVLRRLESVVGPRPELHVHLCLLCEAIRDVRSSTLRSVAEACLPSLRSRGDLTFEPGFRVAIAVELFLDDPHHLIALQAFEQWQEGRRVALEIVGHRRALPHPLDALPWPQLVPLALGSIRGLPSGFEHRVLLIRPGPRRLLLGFRERGGLALVASCDERALATLGPPPPWTLLQLFDDGNRVDAAAGLTRRAVSLASAIGSAAFGVAVRYRVRTRPVTGRMMDSLLQRLADPNDDDWPLIGIVGVAAGLTGQPLIALGGKGDERIEEGLLDLLRRGAVRRSWSDVARLEMDFRGHRFLLHFPNPSDRLQELTYSDAHHDKDLAAEFEQTMWSELGISVHPRRMETALEVRGSLLAPPKVTAAGWNQLLAPRLDRPRRWEIDALTALEQRGLVRLKVVAVLACGDPTIDRAAVGATDTLDCTGEVEMPWAPVDPRDPLCQTDGVTYRCSRCGQVWRPWRDRLPLVRRVRVWVDAAAVWQWLIAEKAPPGLQVLRPGVGFVPFGQGLAWLVQPDLVPRSPEAHPDWARHHAVCWLVLREPRDAGFGRRAATLGDLLERGARAITKVWALGPLGGSGTTFAAPVKATVVVPQPHPPQRPEVRIVAADSRGLWLDGRQLAGARAAGLRTLLALLHHAAEQSGGGERRFQTAERLARLAGGDGVTYAKVQKWVNRLDEAVRQRMPDEPELAQKLVERDRSRGYRLGEGFTCHGLSMEQEVSRARERQRGR